MGLPPPPRSLSVPRPTFIIRLTLFTLIVSIFAQPAPVRAAAPTIYRINAGGGQVDNYGADGYFTGGSVSTTSATIDTSAVVNPAPQAVYQTQRWGATTYTLTGLSPNAHHFVKLHFAETYWSGAGQRRFNVLINGATVLSQYDIFAKAGAKNKAVIETIAVTTTASGQLIIQLAVGAKDQPTLAALQVRPDTPAIHINSGNAADGNYAGDDYYSDGQSSWSGAGIDTNGVYYPPASTVYQAQRWGAFKYTFTDLPTNTPYTVKLHFVETYWTSVGQRNFNVTLNGQLVLNNYDIISQTGGPHRAIAERFTTTSDATGKIVVDFSAGTRDWPTVAALEVVRGVVTPTNILLGAFHGKVNSDYVISDVQDLEAWQGKRNAVLVMFTSWDPLVTDTAFEIIYDIWNHGAVPIVTWEANTGANTPANIDALIANGTYDAYANAWADRMKVFLAGPDGVYGNGDDRRAYMRFAHEMNANWYPWSAATPGSTNTPADYVNMWRHVWSLFQAKGIGNDHLQWAWVPMNFDAGNYPLEQYWPGGQYVDWVGLDAYNWAASTSWSTWYSPIALIDGTINRLSVYGKPIMIPEVGSGSTSGCATCYNAGAKSQFIRELFDYVSIKGVEDGGPRIRLIAWFNIDKETDWAVFGATFGDSTYLAPSGQTYHVYSAYKTLLNASNFIGPNPTHPRLLTDDQFAGR